MIVKPNPARLMHAVYAVLVVTVSVLLILNMGGEGVFRGVPEPIRNPSEYDTLIQAKHADQALAHFPPQIPPDASEVGFYYYPASLRAGSSIQLRYRLPNVKLDKILHDFMPSALQIQNGRATEEALGPNGIPVPSFKTVGFTTLPTDFVVIVIWAAKHPGRDDKWHSSSGVAISKKRDIVVYWAEDWF